MNPLKRKTISLPDRQWDYLKAESDRLGVSQADIIRRIIDVHMEVKK